MPPWARCCFSSLAALGLRWSGMGSDTALQEEELRGFTVLPLWVSFQLKWHIPRSSDWVMPMVTPTGQWHLVPCLIPIFIVSGNPHGTNTHRNYSVLCVLQLPLSSPGTSPMGASAQRWVWSAFGGGQHWVKLSSGLAGGPSSSPWDLCTAARDMASPRASDLGGRKLKIKATDFYDLILEVTNHHFYHIPLLTHGCGYQGTWIIVGRLGGWLLWVPLTSLPGNHGMGELYSL